MPIERITLVRYRTSDGQDHDEELAALLHERRLEVEPSLAAFIASQADAEQPRLPTTIRRYVLAWEEWRVRQLHAQELDEEEPPPGVGRGPEWGNPMGDGEFGTTETQP